MKFPAPEMTLELAAWASNCGSQPISSCAPEHTSRSALRIRAIRLGRASTTWTSCNALVATSTRMVSPASSSRRAPHSGSQANARNLASAGRLIENRSATSNIGNLCISNSLDLVRAMCTETHLVLQSEHMVDVVGLRFVARHLQAQHAELAGVPGQRSGLPSRIEVAGIRSAGSCPQTVVAVSDVPTAVESIES